MKKLSKYLYLAARIIAALILLQTLYFKFTAAEESVYIFKTVGMEPWGRIGIGIIELIAAALLILNSTAWLGGLLGLGLMSGAIAMHSMIIGISVQGDGGYLFSSALIVALCSGFVIVQNREKITSILLPKLTLIRRTI